MQNFGENLKRYRKEAKISQDELAARMGVTPQAVSKWECGLSMPDITLLIPIAELFGITVDELLRGEGKAEPMADRYPTYGSMSDDVEHVKTIADSQGILKDDGVLRIVRCVGNRILDANEKNGFKIPVEFPEELGDRIVHVEIYGGVVGDVVTNGTVNCGSVKGDVTTNGIVNCGGVDGDVTSNGTVNCAGVDGDVTAEGNVACGGVDGEVNARGNVTCGAVREGVEAGGNVRCGSISGNVECGGEVCCGDVNGSIKANTVTCKSIEGNVEAETVNYVE